MTQPSPTVKKPLPVKAAIAKTPTTTKAVSAKAAKPVKAAKPAQTPDASKAAPNKPPKREKLVRDSFTIPKSEYEALGTLKLRANGLAVPAKKSELLRAGIKALAAMTDASFLSTLKGVPTVKTGRPAAEPVTKKVSKGEVAVAAEGQARPRSK